VSVDGFIRDVAAWEPFFDAVSKLPTSAPGGVPDKGKAFERLTQLYLQTEPEYQTKLRHVWHARTQLPREVRKKIGLPPGDEGIDLIAQTRDGKFWAIQCKFRTETHRALTVEELGTFATSASTSAETSPSPSSRTLQRSPSTSGSSCRAPLRSG
jgi:predicted helicase